MLNKALLLATRSTGREIYRFYVDISNAYGLTYPVEVLFSVHIQTEDYQEVFQYDATITTDEEGYFSLNIPGLRASFSDGYFFSYSLQSTVDGSQNFAEQWQEEFLFSEDEIYYTYLNDHS